MNRILKNMSFLLLLGIGFLALLPSCGDDMDEEPAIYTPLQIRRLLTGGESKLWQQRTEYYLEDSCRTGYLLSFEIGAEGTPPSPMLAYFHRDTTECEAGENTYISMEVSTPRSQFFQTTDSLLFVSAAGDSTVRLIRLLSSKRMELDLVTPEGELRREEYRLLEEYVFE